MNHLIILLCMLFSYTYLGGTGEKADPQLLLGSWKIDMSPQDLTDENFALMRIEQVEGNQFEGIFYREGVRIQNGKLNTQLGKLYGALVSADGTGQYNTAFYYEDGLLHGSTHAIERNFLSVWTAKKIKE